MTWCMRVEDLKLIPGSAKAVAAINAAGHATAVVTNQSCVGRGLLSLEGLAAIHARLRELLAAEGTLHPILPLSRSNVVESHAYCALLMLVPHDKAPLSTVCVGGWVDCLLFSEDHPAKGAAPSPFRKPNPGAHACAVA